jgi:hypothetical protein
MAHRAAAPLHQPAHDRKPAIVEVQERQHLAQSVLVQDFRIHAVHPHRVAAPDVGIALAVRVIQVDHPALRDHGVEIEVLLQPFPQLKRLLVERVVARQQVIRPDDGGVAADVARAEIALLQHRHIGDAVYLGKIVGRGQPVPAAADDDHVIFRLRIRRPPCRLPVLVAGQSVAGQREKRILHCL